MLETEKLQREIREKFSLEMLCYREDFPDSDAPVYGATFDGVAQDGARTFFRFFYKNTNYVGVLDGAGAEQKTYALLLISYFDARLDTVSTLSKNERLKRILLGESSSKEAYRYVNKYAVKNETCFALALKIPKRMEETVATLSQYEENGLDIVLKMDDSHCAFVRYLPTAEEEYHSATDYAEFLAQSLKEELGVDVIVGVGSIVREFRDVAVSYTHATNALRYAEVFDVKGRVHSYREFTLVKMLEDASVNKLEEYLSELMSENAREIFEDEEMLSTAEEFLQSNLNVSETSRNLYMHRNTLLYRLDKIEKATGLNIRLFSDAVSFRVLSVLYKLLGK